MGSRAVSSGAHVAGAITIRVYARIDCVCKIGVVGAIIGRAGPHTSVAEASCSVVMCSRAVSSGPYIAGAITIRVYTRIDFVCKVGVVGTIIGRAGANTGVAGIAQARGILVTARAMGSQSHISGAISIRVDSGIHLVQKFGIVRLSAGGTRRRAGVVMSANVGGGVMTANLIGKTGGLSASVCLMGLVFAVLVEDLLNLVLDFFDYARHCEVGWWM